MTKQELINAIAAESGYPKIEVERVLLAQAIVVEAELQERWELVLPGIGKFNTEQRPARKGRNPSTGLAMDIPAKSVVKFKAVKTLRDAVQR